MSDFNLQITVRNARLLRAIRAQYGSSADMCRATGINQTALSALLTMRAKPFRADGSLTTTAEAVVSALGIPADDLWPSHIARLQAKRATVEVEMDAPTFAAIADSDPERQAMMRQALARWSCDLTDRQRDVLAIRFSGGLLEDAARELGVTRERVRQMEHRGLRKLMRRARIDGVRSFAEVVG
jgi:transcriptional regulator with XRE-family HTH domain